MKHVDSKFSKEYENLNHTTYHLDLTENCPTLHFFLVYKDTLLC